MKYPILTLALLVFIFVGCAKDCDSLLPTCLRKKMERNEIQTNGPITRYDTKKGHVFEIILGDFSNVYDENCNVVCTLGGFVGVTDCVNGADTLELTNPVVVWEE
jgi:hypothetical protein